MGAPLWDDVTTSFGLVRTESWVAIDLVAGLAGYVVWVAGSAALGVQVASLADYPVAPDGSPTMSILGLVVLLWLVLPAAVGVARVRSRLLNIRGNVEQHYRLDRPGALLVPPVVLLTLALVAGVALGALAPLLFVVLVPATLYLLIRTAAFAYRVFSFSHPLLVYAVLFATLAVQAGILLVYLGQATENGAVVSGAVDVLGLPVDPLATLDFGVSTAPMGLAIAAALPIVIALAYVLVQAIAGVIVRVRSPTIRPTRVRTGQRYPPSLEVASNGGRTTSATRSGKQTPASKGAGSGGTGSTASDSTDSGSMAADSTTADSTAESADASADAATATDDASTTASADDATADDAEADSVSNTRVFTPPSGTGDDPLSPAAGGDGAECPDCGATVPADADACPACGADAP